MAKSVIIAIIVIGLSGCHAHHHRRTAVHVLDAEHADKTIVVVHKKPARKRKCWKHGSHWHCRK